MKPSEFFINAVSPDPQPPESENYIIKTKLNNGGWTSPRAARGILKSEPFCVDEDMIYEAIKTLNLHRQVHVKTT